jgi:hypothetical protein
MSPKRDITMATAEVDAFLRSQSQAIVVGGPEAGAPWGAVARLAWDGSRVAFSLRSDDPLVAALEQDSRACCVVEQFPSYYEIMGVMLHGHARPRPGSGSGPEATFDLDVEAIVSFDFGKLVDD